jgi:MFS family permease
VTRWIAAGGAFVVSLDSMVNVAFPAMGAAFAAPPEQLRWVIVCYVLAYAVLSLAGGVLGDAIGHVRVLRLGLAGSVLAFAAAGLAPTYGWLLAARALQGVAAGLIYGTTPALVTHGLADHQRARALGFLNAAIGLAFSVAPTLAGWLVDHAGWRAVFLVRAPLALGVLAWVLVYAGPAPARLAAPAMTARDVVQPGVLVPGLLAFAANGGIFAIWLLAPFYLVERRGLATVVAGLLFTLTPLGMTAGAALAGRLPTFLAGRGAVAAGLVLEAAGLLALSTAGPGTPVGALALALFVAGLGLGLFQVPNMASLMREFPPGRQGAAGGLAFLARTLGVVAGVLGLARLFADLRATAGFDAGFARAYLAAALAVTAAALLGALRPPPTRPRPGRTA